MDEPQQDDDGLIDGMEFTPLEEVAIYCHEMYEALVMAGFSEQQALWLTAHMDTSADMPDED